MEKINNELTKKGKRDLKLVKDALNISVNYLF